MREGPSTKYTHLGNLTKGEELDIIGQYKDCAWLQVSSRDQEISGWIFGSSEYVERGIACENIPPGTYRPFTGLIKSNQNSGRGELTVDNGSSIDGVVVLKGSGVNFKGSVTFMAAYIRAGEKFNMRGIRDGIYCLYFTKGSEWNGEKFTCNESYQRFEDFLYFSTTFNRYTTWSVTLHGVVGGTASTDYLDEEDFPVLGE